jgi:hypothetical protein
MEEALLARDNGFLARSAVPGGGQVAPDDTVVALDDDHQTSYELQRQQRNPSDVTGQDITASSASTQGTQVQAQVPPRHPAPLPPLAGQAGGRPQRPDAVASPSPEAVMPSVVVRFADAALGDGRLLAVPFAVPRPTALPLLFAQDVSVHVRVRAGQVNWAGARDGVPVA